jgi:cytochrome P450
MQAAAKIIEIAGDPTRPRSPVPFARELGHIPGRSGLLAGLQTIVGMLRQGERSFHEPIRKYGPVFRHALGPDPAVFVSDPDLIYSILRNDEGTWSSALVWTHFFHGLFPGTTGDGLLQLDGQSHREARRVLQPAFAGPALAGYIEDAEAIYERTIGEWIARRRIGFKAEVRRLFAMVSAKLFMGVDDPAEAAMLDRAMTDGWQAVLAVRKRKTLSFGWRRAQRGIDTLWSSLRPRMEKRKMGGTDLLSRMCQTHDEAAWLDDDARMRLFIAIMFGAFDTTASGSASMAYLLARYPEWQERLAPEYTDIAWKETLRLFPVAGFLSRQALCETRLGEHRIPEATLVHALTGNAQRDPKFWTEPDKFDPERFSPERAEDKKHKAIFLPFGAGAHACIGAQLAALEVKAFWQAMLRRCRFKLVKPYEARHTYTPIGIVSGDVALELEPI